MKRLIAVLLVLALGAGLAACKKEEVNTPIPTDTTPVTEPAPEGKTVDLCLPEEEAWKACADALTAQLQAVGHTVRVQYAQNDAQEQAKQIESLAEQESACAVVVPVDALAVAEALQAAVNAGVKVVTLDRQALPSRGLQAEVTFDYAAIGKTIARQIVTAKSLETAKKEKRKYTIEFLMGATEDYSTQLIHGAIMAVLQPYLDSGVLVCKTGRTSLEDTYVQGWDTDQARRKCQTYLKEYKDETVDILCAASDSIAAGCIAALEAKEYTEKDWPMITGLGGEEAALRSILSGKQAATVCKDQNALWDTCGRVVLALLADQPLPAGDTVIPGSEEAAPVFICPVYEALGKDGVEALPEQFAVEEAPVPETTAPPEITAPPETTVPPETTTPPETTAPPETSVPAETK